MEDEVYSQPNHEENWIIVGNGQRNLYRKANLCYSNILSAFYIREQFPSFSADHLRGGAKGPKVFPLVAQCQCHAMPMFEEVVQHSIYFKTTDQGEIFKAVWQLHDLRHI